MKIGFFTDGYLPSVHGVTVSIETFRKNLEKLGHEVFVFAPAHPRYKDTNPRVFRFKSIRAFAKSDTYFALPFLPQKKQLKEILALKLDICHAHSPFNMGFFGKYISSHQDIPLVYTHHTLYSAYAKYYLKESLITPYLARVWSTWFSNLSDLVIAPSPKIKKMLKSYGVKKRIEILPTGIDTDLFKINKSARKKLREKLNISQDTQILIYAGRIVEEKNIHFILESFIKLSKKKDNVILLLVGPALSTNPYIKKLKEKISQAGIENRVIFTGPIPHKEMPFYYQGSDIFLFASLTDTQGIVILEAEACGLPIVALRDEAFTNIVEENKNCFLVKKANPDLFAKKILEILNNKNTWNSFSKRSYQISQKFSEEKQTKKLLKIYKLLL